MSRLEDQLKELDRLRKRGVVTGDEYAARRAAVIYDPTNLRPESGQRDRGQRGRGIFKWSLLGCLAVVLAPIILFVIVVVAVLAALSGATKGISEAKHRLETPPAALPAVTASSGGVQLSVTGLEREYLAVGNQPLPEPGFHYVRLRVEFLVERGEHLVNPNAFTLTDALGVKHSPTGRFGCRVANSSNAAAGGRVGPATLCFQVGDVPQGALSLTWATYDDAGKANPVTLGLP